MKWPMRGLLLALPALLFSLSAAASPLRELQQPVVSLPAGHTPAEVSANLRAAFDRHGWTVTSDSGSHMLMTYEGARYDAKIDVEYSAASVTVHYLSSNDLYYQEKNGKRYIADRYNQWVATATKDLLNFLANGIPPPLAQIRGTRDATTQAALIRIDDDQFVLTEYAPDHPVRTLAGPHAIGLRYDENDENGHSTWSYQASFTLDAVAGAHYTVRYRRAGNVVKFKVVDDASGASVGKANDPDELLE